jgi:MFS family permease
MFRSIATTYREAFSGLSRSVWLLSVASLINRAGTMVMPFLVLFLVQERGFTTTQAGEALALYGLGAMVSSYFGGWLCDRFSPIRIMKVSLAGTGLAFIALGHLQGRLAISAMVVVLSLVGEVFRPANLAALSAASDPGERARSFALLRLAVNAGMSVGPTVGGLLAAYDYGLLFWADGITSILAAVLLVFAFPARLAAAPAVHSAAKVRAGSPFRDLPVMALLGMMFLLNIVTFQVTSTFPLSLRDLYGFSEAWIGVTLAANTLIIVLFEMVLIHSLARRDPLKVAGFGTFLFCAGLALLPFGSGFGYVLFTVVIWTMGEMLAFPLLVAAVADRAPEATRGAYMGLMNFSFAASFVVAPLVGTWVYQHLGARALWLGCGVVGLLVWAGFQAVAVAIARPVGAPSGPALTPPTPSLPASPPTAGREGA